MNFSAIFTAAWTAARKAAALFGGSARAFFALSLKAAYAAARASKTLEQVATETETLPGVYTAKVWNGRRVYVNFIGMDRAKAGDRNLKIFWERKLGWVIEGVKGNMSRDMRRSAVSFCEAVNLRVIF